MSQLVIYHGPGCVDGFTAAWCAWLKYGDAAEYVPAQYGDAPPDVTGRDVLIVDFSYPRAVLEEMAKAVKSLTIFDHHKTARDDLMGKEPNGSDSFGFCARVVFDMDRSGAGITWDELHGTERPEENAPLWLDIAARESKRPWIVDYAEDRDLWRFKFPHSKEVNEYLAIQPKTFERWREMCALEHLSTAQWHGATLLQATAAYVETMKTFSQLGQLVRVLDGGAPVENYPGFTPAPIVNAPPPHASDLLGALAEGHPFAVGWFQRADGVYQYSLRSRGDGGADVSAIAKAFGGGGHRNAAGFESKERVDALFGKAGT